MVLIISMALSESGTRCCRPAFIRSAGTVHKRASRSISDHLAPNTSLVRAAAKVAGHAAHAKPTSTEAGIFARAGCEAIVIGPGRSTGNAHTANERIESSQLEKAIDLYESLLIELCGAY